MEFTHFDENGNALMVDVSEKAETKREATARGSIYMSPECLKKVKEGTMAKGDVLGVARVAGIMGAKKTSELIPLCHLLNLTKLTVDFTIKEETNEIEAACTARTTGKTGVEMEALTGVNIALLTITICVRQWTNPWKWEIFTWNINPAEKAASLLIPESRASDERQNGKRDRLHAVFHYRPVQPAV